MFPAGLAQHQQRQQQHDRQGESADETIRCQRRRKMISPPRALSAG
jgi:hypothetical protein